MGFDYLLRDLIGLVILFVLSTTFTGSAFADLPKNAFNSKILAWNQHISIAKTYLRKAAMELKSGSRYKACKNQKLASMHGVEAYLALISLNQAFESDDEIAELQTNLENWKRLAECHNTNNLINTL